MAPLACSIVDIHPSNPGRQFFARDFFFSVCTGYAVSDYQYYALKVIEMTELAQRATGEATKREFERLAHEYERLAENVWPETKRA